MADVDRNLLFGLIALRVGLIDEAQLVAAFQAWGREKARSLADYLSDQSGLDADGRAALLAMVALHLRTHGDDAEKSLAAIPVSPATREQLVAVRDPELTVTIAHCASVSSGLDGVRTTNDPVGSTTSNGQRFQIMRPQPRAALGASPWHSTPSCIARLP